MTREEAKRRMEICRDFLANNYSDMGEPNFTAFNMAIQALSQEPCTDAVSRTDIENCIRKCMSYTSLAIALRDLPPITQKPIECDDAISREWLMRKATERFYTTNYFNHISAMIEEAPSVTQKSGKWIKSLIYENTYNCSKCGSAGYDTFKFCPNCGAKMESEDKE